MKYIHSQSNHCKKERINRIKWNHLLLDKGIVQRIIGGLSEPLPKTSY